MDAPRAVLEVLAARGLDVRKCRVRAMRSYRYRPIFHYSLTCFDEATGALVRKVVIGKRYAGEGGAAMFELLRELWQNGFGRDPCLTIPEPIAYVPALGLLLQDLARGKDLHHHLDHPARSLRHVRRAARWLAKLHGMPAARAQLLRLPDEAESAARHGRALGKLFPAFARRIEAITGRVITSMRTLGARPSVPTHGDFQPKNIHVSGDRITVFDFDRFALGHPARDLGHFIAQCLTMSYTRAGAFREVEPWNVAFLDEYRRNAPPEATSALSTFVPRSFLEILHHKLFVFPVADPSFLPAWLDACEQWEDLG